MVECRAGNASKGRAQKMRWFNYEEFDSPDQPGSGHLMCDSFLDMIDEARTLAGIPFVVTSGYRTEAHQAKLKRQGYKTSPTSAHLLGRAADIAATTSHQRYCIISAALEAGFTRIGIGSTFIHLDNCHEQDGKTPELIWTY